MPQKYQFSFKKYPLSWCCIALICVLSLTPFIPETRLNNVAFVDKWTHFIMYGGSCCVIWWEHLRCCKCQARRPNRRALMLWAGAGLILLGALMELLQAYATTTRSGEWLDLLADTVGVLLGTAIGWLSTYWITIKNP